MTTQSPNNSENAFESFPKPRTFPANWYLSEVMPSKQAESPEGVQPADKMETFPQPRTIPDKWDVSGFSK